jgi:hypothetical protein
MWRLASHGPESLDAAVSTIRRSMVPSEPIRVTTTLRQPLQAQKRQDLGSPNRDASGVPGRFA